MTVRADWGLSICASIFSCNQSLKLDSRHMLLSQQFHFDKSISKVLFRKAGMTGPRWFYDLESRRQGLQNRKVHWGTRKIRVCFSNQQVQMPLQEGLSYLHITPSQVWIIRTVKPMYHPKDRHMQLAILFYHPYNHRLFCFACSGNSTNQNHHASHILSTPSHLRLHHVFSL